MECPRRFAALTGCSCCRRRAPTKKPNLRKAISANQNIIEVVRSSHRSPKYTRAANHCYSGMVVPMHFANVLSPAVHDKIGDSYANCISSPGQRAWCSSIDGWRCSEGGNLGYDKGPSSLRISLGFRVCSQAFELKVYAVVLYVWYLACLRLSVCVCKL